MLDEEDNRLNLDYVSFQNTNVEKIWRQWAMYDVVLAQYPRVPQPTKAPEYDFCDDYMNDYDDDDDDE